MIVDKWVSEAWAQQHNEARERRMMMPGVPHYQGSRNLARYAQAWVHEFRYLFKSPIVPDL
jgi:hypothetical protein